MQIPLPGFVRNHWFTLLLFVVVLTRLPFVVSGYGSDADAWRVAFVANTLWTTGVYDVSRLPGYPLHEIVSAPLVSPGGSILSNSATLVITLILLAVWKHLAERFTAHPKLLVVSLAFAPYFWENSATTMDYHWSLLFMLLSFLAALRSGSLLSGIWLGIACGFRPTNLMAALPVLAVLVANGASGRSIMKFVSAVTSATLIAFFPVILRYGPIGVIELTMMQTDEIGLRMVDRVAFFAYRGVYSIGPLACLVGTVILLRGRSQIAALLRRRDPVMVMSIVGIPAFLLLFLVYPLEREYLLPAFPLLLLLVDKVASKKLATTFAVCFVSFSLINPDIIRHEGLVGKPGFNLREGAIFDELAKRKETDGLRMTLAGLNLDGKSIVIIGRGPQLWFENGRFAADEHSFNALSTDPSAHLISNADVHFVDNLKLTQIKALASEGYALYCFGPMQLVVERNLGKSVSELGIKLVP